MRTWIKDPLAIFAEGAERGIVVEATRIASLVKAGEAPDSVQDEDAIPSDSERGAEALPRPETRRKNPRGARALFAVFDLQASDEATSRLAERTPIRFAGFVSTLDAGSGLTGLAKMVVIRGNEAKVLTALGLTSRILKAK